MPALLVEPDATNSATREEVRRIVVYERDPALRKVLREMIEWDSFEGEQYGIEFADTLVEIGELVATGTFDLVIADTRESAAIVNLSRLAPLIVLTGDVSEWGTGGLNPGTMVVQKPMDLGPFLDNIAVVINHGLDDPTLVAARAQARRQVRTTGTKPALV